MYHILQKIQKFILVLGPRAILPQQGYVLHFAENNKIYIGARSMNNVYGLS